MENVGFYNMGEVTMNLHREENDRSGVVTMNRWYEHNDNHCSAAEQPGPNHYYYHRGLPHCHDCHDDCLPLMITFMERKMSLAGSTSCHSDHFFKWSMIIQIIIQAVNN